MGKSNQERHKPELNIPKDEARRRIAAQIEKAKTTVPNASVNENDEARRWYDYTSELLRQIFTVDEVVDEFTGRGSYGSSGDITTNHFLKRLISIFERLELYPEHLPAIAENNHSNAVTDIERLFHTFHRVIRQLGRRYDNRSSLTISDEYDVQDVMHALLRIFFDDIRPEEWTPSYAGGSARMDFLIPSAQIVIETKKVTAKLNAKVIGDQLAIDIMRYHAHPSCKSLLCFVYDPDEHIINPKGLEHDLNRVTADFQVKVFIVQR